LKADNERLRQERAMIADITYVVTGEGWLYLAGVLDLYNRRLIGWATGSSLATALPLAALHMALRRRRLGQGLLHHSDRS
jgi:putative transposase